MNILCPVSWQRMKVLQIVQPCSQEIVYKINEFLWTETQNLLPNLEKEEGKRGGIWKRRSKQVLVSSSSKTIYLGLNRWGLRHCREIWYYFGSFQPQMNFFVLKQRSCPKLAGGWIQPDCKSHGNQEPPLQRQEIKAGPGTVCPFRSTLSELSFCGGKRGKEEELWP